MGGNVRLEASACPSAAVLLRGAPKSQVLAAPQEGAQRWRLGVRERAWRGAEHVGTRRQRTRLPRLRFGQLPSGACTIARLPRVDHDDRQASRRPRGRGGAFSAPGGFQHHQGGVERLQPFHEQRDSTGLVGDGPPRSGGAHGNIPLGLRHINPHTTRHVNPKNSYVPALAETGSRAPDTWTGLRSPGRDDPRSAPVSADQGSIGLSRPGTG